MLVGIRLRTGGMGRGWVESGLACLRRHLGISTREYQSSVSKVQKVKGVMTGTTTLTLIWCDTQKGNPLMAKREAKGSRGCLGKSVGKREGLGKRENSGGGGE